MTTNGSREEYAERERFEQIILTQRLRKAVATICATHPLLPHDL